MMKLQTAPIKLSITVTTFRRDADTFTTTTQRLTISQRVLESMISEAILAPSLSSGQPTASYLTEKVGG